MRKMNHLIASLLVATMATTSLGVSAEGEWREAGWYVSDDYSITCDTFKYTTHHFYGITLETELTDANFMVSGIAHNEDGTVNYIVLTSINGGVNASRGLMFATPGNAEFFPSTLKWSDLQLGDLLKFGNHEDQTISPPIINPNEDVEVIGNGVDILGDDFRKVIRHELIAVPRASWEDVDAVKYFETIEGDVNEDDEVGIMDVIKLNKYNLGSCSLGYYSSLVADVDRNGTLDSTDSLLILKEVVGITENFKDK